MSGPIVRRYGFPNFDKIFGERPLQHGVEEPEQPESPGDEEADPSESAPKQVTRKKGPRAKKAENS
jgi:hypothetical protein